jgi:hypothetical protein
MNKISPQQCHEELTQLFDTQTSELQAINSYLTKIKYAVAENDVEALNNLITEQRLPIKEIEILQEKQHQLMSRYNFKSNNTGLDKCIAWCDRQDKLLDRYQIFKQEMETLQHSLQISDMLVSKGQNRIRQSLHLLTGQTVNTRTYTSSGQSQESTDGRSIAHA